VQPTNKCPCHRLSSLDRQDAIAYSAECWAEREFLFFVCAENKRAERPVLLVALRILKLEHPKPKCGAKHDTRLDEAGDVASLSAGWKNFFNALVAVACNAELTELQPTGHERERGKAWEEQSFSGVLRRHRPRT
jgi:hypothetical protein